MIWFNLFGIFFCFSTYRPVLKAGGSLFAGHVVVVFFPKVSYSSSKSSNIVIIVNSGVAPTLCFIVELLCKITMREPDNTYTTKPCTTCLWPCSLAMLVFRSLNDATDQRNMSNEYRHEYVSFFLMPLDHKVLSHKMWPSSPNGIIRTFAGISGVTGPWSNQNCCHSWLPELTWWLHTKKIQKVHQPSTHKVGTTETWSKHKQKLPDAWIIAFWELND